jgi:FKBP-type peptidyl-prolyl cis-trans isomerase FklB
MKKSWILALLVGALGPWAAAAQEAEADSAEDGNLEGRVSYIIGLQLGSNFKDDPFEIDLDRFIEGLRDALAGEEPEMSEEEMQQTMLEFQEKILAQEQARMESLSAENREEGDEYLEKNKQREGVKTTDSGLQYEVVKEGKGDKPTAQDTVTVHYNGTLIDGTKFDSSYDRGEPATFPVSGVIPGWTEALQLMNVGSTFKIVVPSDLAYGARGAGGVIGPNETLIFDVELLGIEGKE